jgi:hypothetical protein
MRMEFLTATVAASVAVVLASAESKWARASV